jgi:hypothetical protein
LDAYFKKIRQDLQESIVINKKKQEEEKPKDDHLKQAMTRAKRSLEDLKQITVLLCDIKVQRKKEEDNAMTFIKNIADIPISIDNFYTKIWKEITQPGVAFYDMNSFLEKFCLPLLNESLDRLPASEIVEDVHYKMTTFTSRELRRRINRGIINIDDVPKASQAFTRKSIENSSEYIVISQSPSQYSRSPGSGNKKSDIKRGIFHLRPNKDRGFLKNITFSKISLPGREASLVVGNGDVYDELRLPHNASANMFGNFMFMPGSQVYVDPNTLGFGSVKDKNSAARRLGFGGYYTVENVKTTFTNGELATVLTLLFNAFPETNDEPSLSESQRRSITKMTNIMGNSK